MKIALKHSLYKDDVFVSPNSYQRCEFLYFSYFGELFLVAQTVKNLPSMQGTWVQTLSQEGPLKKGMATHSSILAWKILWTEEPGGLQSTESQKGQTQLSD